MPRPCQSQFSGAMNLSSGFAQSEDIRALELFNTYDSNIAGAGMYGRNALTLRFRQQWVGFEGAPKMQYISFHRPLGEKMIIGGRVYSDEIGLFKRNIALASIGYVIENEAGKLSFALGGGINSQSFNVNEATLPENDDELNQLATNVVSPVILAAVLYRSENWFGGVEVTNLLKSSQTFLEQGIGKQDLHALAQLGFQKQLNANWDLRPLIAVRWAEKSIVLPEAQVGFRYQKRIWLGAGMRLNGSGYGLAEWVMNRRFRLAYAHEWNLNILQDVQQGSHELMIGFLFGKPTTNSPSKSSFHSVL